MLPAFIWVVVGTVFFAGVHDFGAIWASLRNGAKSIGALSGDVVGQRARDLFMVVIFLLLLMVNAVFVEAVEKGDGCLIRRSLGSLGEGALALMAVIAATTGFQSRADQVMAVLFAGTEMDAGVRLPRCIVRE